MSGELIGRTWMTESVKVIERFKPTIQPIDPPSYNNRLKKMPSLRAEGERVEGVGVEE